MIKIDEAIRNEVQSIFEHLHENPEISWEEVNTTKFIEEKLSFMNFDVETFSDCTGLVATIGSGNPVVTIRADIDALWQEVNGSYQANHSCGHDAHTAIVLGVAMLLQNNISNLTGTIKLIFQPAEEKGTGALKMIEKGAVNDVDYLYGIHLRPIQELEHGAASAGISHGAGTLLTGRIIGDDTHGARPHLGTNIIEVGAEIVQKLNHIHVNPMVPHSVKITSFIADGGSLNIIPGSADFSIDIRSQTNEVMTELNTSVQEIIDNITSFYKLKYSLEKATYFPAAIIDSEAKEHLKTAISNVLGSENTLDTILTTGGDDFHFYKIKNPEIKAIMLGLGCDLKPGLHHADMSFNHDSLINGVYILYEAIKNTMSNPSIS